MARPTCVRARQNGVRAKPKARPHRLRPTHTCQSSRDRLFSSWVPRIVNLGYGRRLWTTNPTIYPKFLQQLSCLLATMLQQQSVVQLVLSSWWLLSSGMGILGSFWWLMTVTGTKTYITIVELEEFKTNPLWRRSTAIIPSNSRMVDL